MSYETKKVRMRDLQPTLDEMGADGWRLVTALDIGLPESVPEMLLIFERPTPARNIAASREREA